MRVWFGEQARGCGGMADLVKQAYSDVAIL